ncbi:D-2-hydroxyacid dehydrogenase [Litoreibacter janthinus]|uniref:Phosphoglycerate dehydrogenase n=1 Tax=Litoreibacter janthinus TaxID=670154 RepID=A0A1I6GN67_9RHOB|nr:D-2-hydroxyacid dehydrogenase [Litoreibacter janthinus]SFR43663.1 Phosphoglycerate dehydrogenase [Litoreibacter janthinus]
MSRPPQISDVVTNVEYEAPLYARMCEVFGDAKVTRITPGNPEALRQALEHAEVAVLQELLPAEDIRGSRLKWVHITHSGMDRVASPVILDRGIRLSSSAGYSVEALAEHALFFMLSLAYRSKDLFEAQRKSSWEKAGRQHLRSLYKQSVGIVGLGHIGKALAVRCDAMGMHVLGYRRSDEAAPQGVHELYSQVRGDSLKSMLAQCDYVVLAVPLTNESHNMIGAEELAQMKPTAHLVNVARGAVVDEPALIHALQTGQIAGAGLDVFVTEPLPAESPFWQMPNVIVTPHTSAREPDRDDRAVDLIAENHRRFLAGEQLLNELTRDNVYTP